jgi:spore coat protein U-like protein
MRLSVYGVLALSLLGSPDLAQAGADCSVEATGVAFGVYDPFVTTPDDAAGTITVTCVYVPPGTTNVSYSVTLSPGMNSANALARQMAAGTPRLNYNVFDDSARSAVWGNGLGGTVLATGAMTVGPGVGNGTRTATHTVYGRIPALQDALPGNYLDTLVLSLTY